MPPFIQQKFSLTADSASIVTFDHGLLRPVHVELPVNKYSQRVPLNQFWRLRRVGGLKWEYFCSCPPPGNTPGIPARCYTVNKQGSRFNGRTYLGCGKTRQRCLWKADARPPAEPEFPDPEEFNEEFNEEFAQLMNDLQIQEAQSNAQLPTSPKLTEIEELGKDFGKLLGDVPLAPSEQALLQSDTCRGVASQISAEFNKLMEDLTISTAELISQGVEPMIWNAIAEEWQLSEADYNGLVAYFAGQDDVFVSRDGCIHYIPAPELAFEDSAVDNSIPDLSQNSDDELGVEALSPELNDKNMHLDIEMERSDSPEEALPSQRKKKVASLPSDHPMFIDLTLTLELDQMKLSNHKTFEEMEISGCGTSAEPYEIRGEV
ncbi:uncharacterized protein C8R40DRAFT_1071675 [Lentinula edodes]|uniref:uncharacterized protein n=1 Tax=Lentinula edodes TaxID=5353 RepID=UPI001E8DD793|nr:uncharacterized protein C8R40DRAFT_1071675 [Lentinula edodes]KAH7872442.1 hypothetical protein C8R40DRAFT_1071675 [Lentinula edodes]